MNGMYSPIGMQGAGAQPVQAVPPSQGQLSPELVQAVLQLQQQRGGQDDVQRQMAMAQALRQQGMQGMQSQGVGGRAGPPNWAGALANVFAQYKAGQMDQDAQLKRQNMDAQRADALRRYFEAATSQNRPAVGFMGDEGE